MSKPEGPGVMRANMVLVWHAGQSGRWMIMMLSLVSRESSQRSVAGAYEGGCNHQRTAASLTLFHFAHLRKFNVSGRNQALPRVQNDCRSPSVENPAKVGPLRHLKTSNIDYLSRNAGGYDGCPYLTR